MRPPLSSSPSRPLSSGNDSHYHSYSTGAPSAAISLKDGSLELSGYSQASSRMPIPAPQHIHTVLEANTKVHNTYLTYSVIPILILLSRSKLVPDFALTIHLLHTITTTIYTRSLPTNLLWWLLQFGSAFLMVSLGVWACRYREMQPITFGLGGKPADSQPQANGSIQGSSARMGRMGDENLRGDPERGRREGSGPSYEMVPIKEADFEGDENV